MPLRLATEICADVAPTINAPASESTGAGACAGSVTLSTTVTACGEFAAPSAKIRTTPKYWPAVRLEESTETITEDGVAVAFSQPSGPDSICTVAVQFKSPCPALATANVCGGDAAPPEVALNCSPA